MHKDLGNLQVMSFMVYWLIRTVQDC